MSFFSQLSKHCFVEYIQKQKNMVLHTNFLVKSK